MSVSWVTPMSDIKSRPTHNETSAPVSLADLAQLAELGARSERLRVRVGVTEGVLYIDRGVLVHAYFGNLTGERAAQAMFKNPEQPAVRLQFEEPETRSFEVRPSQMLLVFAVESDEITRYEGPQSKLGASGPAGGAPAEAGLFGGASPTVSPLPVSRSGAPEPNLGSFDHFLTQTGSHSSPGPPSSRSGNSGSKSYRSQASSAVRSSAGTGSGVASDEGRGWLWRALALFCLAGIVSYSYFRFVGTSSHPDPKDPIDRVVEAESLTGLTDVMPRLVKEVAPVQPDASRSIQPTILIRTLVAADGTVQQTQVIDSRTEVEAFERAAEDAVRQYRFKPAQQSGQVVAAWMNVPISFASSQPPARVSVGGSLGFERFAAQLALLFEATPGGGHVEFDFAGAGPCTAALLSAAVDVCLTTRPVTKQQLKVADAVGAKLQEHTVGYAYASIFVNQSNSLEQLSLFQVSALFRGNHTSWGKLPGGSEQKVVLFGLSLDSKAADVFRSSVLSLGGNEAKFPKTMRVFSGPQALLSALAETPGAIAFSEVRAAGQALPRGVRAMPIASANGQLNGKSSLATPETIAGRAYPIRGKIWVYARAELQQPPHRFLSTVFSDRGRKTATENLISPGPRVQLPAFRPPTEAVVPYDVQHVEFIAGSAGLDVTARLLLDKMALRMAQKASSRAVVVGHGDPSSEPSQSEQIAKERGDAVRSYLSSGVIAKERVQALSAGTSLPLAIGSEASDQQRNRRVDIYLLEE